MSILYWNHPSQRPYSVHFVLIKPQYTTPHSVNMKNRHRESYVLHTLCHSTHTQSLCCRLHHNKNERKSRKIRKEKQNWRIFRLNSFKICLTFFLQTRIPHQPYIPYMQPRMFLFILSIFIGWILIISA